MSFLILSHVVVTLLAFCTLQCDSCTHNFHLASYFFVNLLLGSLRGYLIFRHKKKTYFHSLVQFTIPANGRQVLFFHIDFLNIPIYFLFFSFFADNHTNNCTDCKNCYNNDSYNCTCRHVISCFCSLLI